MDICLYVCISIPDEMRGKVLIKCWDIDIEPYKIWTLVAGLVADLKSAS